MRKLRYILKRGKGGKPREKILQEYVNEEFWLDVPTVFEEEAEDWEQENFREPDE